MFLKNIEIRGFKSFADKTELIFKGGVTSIVGPNGSGKSNISDAIKWVLGEQSVKSLRGGKMEDVIFAGTQYRKPVGLCQVSLTLNNEDKKLPIDYSDVTVSRRLYRSGESEYYINNTQCRLKDVNELFMDTGIGREGYSIIGQGKIDALLSGKPEDRRSVLEEAAGIVKFKWRKEEAEKKLSNTDANLVRIEDILETHTERLESLKEENDKANEFLKLSKNLKEKEINLLVHSMEKIESKIGENQKSTDFMDKEVKELNLEFVDLKCKITNGNEQIEDFNNKNSDCKTNYYGDRERVQQTEGEIKLLKQRIENLKETIEKNFLELKQVEESNRKKLQQVELQKDGISKLKADKDKLENDISEYNDNIGNVQKNAVEREDLYKKLKDDQIEYLSNISNLKNDISSAQKEIEDTLDKINNMKSSCESYVHSIKINASTKDMLVSKVSSIKKLISEYQDKVKENKRKISKFNTNLVLEEKNLKELNKTYNKLEANYAVLLNLQQHYEGYNRSVKSLMKDIKDKAVRVPENSCFLLGEVIELPKEYETCIEVALGSAISNIITEDEITAKALIKHLKNKNMGRATFLPLNIIKGKKISNSERFKGISGYIGIASEVINYKDKFKNALEYVLGRTVICEDMDSALKIAKLSGYSFRIVTLAGDVVNSGGSLTGGSFQKKSSNIIGRKREIEESAIKINKTSESLKDLNGKVQEYKKCIKELDEEILDLKEKGYSENIELTKIQGKINNIDNESSKLIENMKISNREIDILTKNKELKEKNLEDKKKKLENSLGQQNKNDSSILKIEKELEENKSNIEKMKEKLLDFKVKKAQLDESILNENRELKRLTDEIQELSVKKSRIIEQNKDCENNIHNQELKVNENKEKIRVLKKSIEILKNNIEENDKELIKLKDSVKKCNEKLESLTLLINKKEEKLHKVQVVLARLNSEKENMCLKLKNEIKITYEEALKYKKDIENLDKYNSDVVNLKNSISKLGIVNLGAIQEYSDLREKVTFLSTQREDLVKSKEELNNVIDAMTEKMRTVFKKNFDRLKESFNETFKELFKGGSADLIITGGDELSGNIDITVQPPGKRLQNINLMSGGEKGLSAIALLFAILKIKPTPFCILDEIEAALDDANVARYASFLKKFSNETQFIVITHRRGTMEASDVLYGVTMQEKGVSKIVSVSLKDEY
ncbi:chromosome segregation protein SMC [Clostridium coskatii]|uniref:Chromosome partition protein Smc n=1 Tax=Clostridium coskatii TaxID=1705578 RepID=A0A166TZ73_9CLOT|nr:chromosome segregation protein SMC [Clostridium coskatii]OAA94373.1 Chromosome partition protein Smc [Clostridium coskatii]OBR93117.1 chromosome partition protein Smc [Clostridium coskatii]